jgi:polyhydroxybutyrate depolymerase
MQSSTSDRTTIARQRPDLARRTLLAGAGSLGLSLVGGLSHAQSGAFTPGTHDLTLQHRGLTRTYRLHVPPGYTGQRPTPLVLALHGGGGTGERTEHMSGLSPISDRAGFIVVYPNAVGNLWKDGVIRNEVDNRDLDDVGFIAALIDELASRGSIDRSRVYSTGLSNGGHMSNRLAVDISDRFAAIAPIGATMEASFAATRTPKLPMPVIYFHGTADPLRFYTGGGAPGGKTLSARAMTDWWVEKNGCSTKGVIEKLANPVDDGMSVTRERYGGGRSGSEVILYTIEGGGHTWPGGEPYYTEERVGKVARDISASELMWAFFTKHHRKQA